MRENVIRFIWRDIEASAAAVSRLLTAGVTVLCLALVAIMAIVVVVSVVARWREARTLRPARRVRLIDRALRTRHAGDRFVHSEAVRIDFLDFGGDGLPIVPRRVPPRGASHRARRES